MASPARELNETGDNPGGQLKHFCVPLYAASTPHSSNFTGTPPSDVTQSISSIAPLSCAIFPSSSIGCQAPVEVSACTIPTTFGRNFFTALATSSEEKTCPHALSIFSTLAPALCATSTILCPNTPFTHTSIPSPGSMRLSTHASIPAD